MLRVTKPNAYPVTVANLSKIWGENFRFALADPQIFLPSSFRHRFRANPSPCQRVGKPSEKGLGKKWLKCLGALGSITAAEKHFNTKHWLNDMIIIPIEVFRKYLYNFGV
jgi:hypothetical protein